MAARRKKPKEQTPAALLEEIAARFPPPAKTRKVSTTAKTYSAVIPCKHCKGKGTRRFVFANMDNPEVAANAGVQRLFLDDVPADCWLPRWSDRTKPQPVVEIARMSGYHLLGALRALHEKARRRCPVDKSLLEYLVATTRQYPNLCRETARRGLMDNDRGILPHIYLEQVEVLAEARYVNELREQLSNSPTVGPRKKGKV